MPDAGERAYAYTRACGIIGRSFTGKRLAALGKLHSLGEFDRLVFPELRRELPGRELLHDLETRIVKRSVDHILKVLNAYTEPPELLVRLLRVYEYADLKTCLHCLAGGIKKIPVASDLGRFGTVRFNAFPDLAVMLAGTEFDFIVKQKTGIAAGTDINPIETELDKRYYQELTNSLRRLGTDDRSIAQRILAEEISLKNCVWALRLRTYFKKSAAETAAHLMDIKMRANFDMFPGGIRIRIPASGSEGISLADDALAMLHFQLDSRTDWRGWRWERLLNPEQGGEWAANPRYFQNAASRYLYSLAMRSLRRTPMSVSAAFCFIKIKQFEENMLTSVAEGLSMGMPGSEVFELLEAVSHNEGGR